MLTTNRDMVRKLGDTRAAETEGGERVGKNRNIMDEDR